MLDYVRKCLYLSHIAQEGCNKVITLQHETKANHIIYNAFELPSGYGSVQHGRS